MELGLSLGSEASNPLGLMENPTAVPTEEGSLAFCMDTSNSPNNYGDMKHEEGPHEEGSQQQDEGEVQGKESVNTKEKNSQGEASDDSTEDEAKRESDKEMDHHHHKSCPIQLDLLPNTPVLRRSLHDDSLFSCHHTLHGNRNSEVLECSIKLENIGRGLDMKRVQPKVMVDLDLTNHQHHRGEEAVAINDEDVSSSPQNSGASSMFRMDFSLFNNINKFSGNINEGDHDDNDNYKHSQRRASLSEEDEKRSCTRKKLRLSKEQSAFLEESFKEHSTLNPKQKLALAKQLNLRPRQVEVWFQNRRARTKLKQTEVDCEYLKRCCETLKEENRRLHKEIQELRALKTSNPFCKQLPATTLTMCPSCEKILTTTTTNNNANNIKNNNIVSNPTTRPRFYPFSQT